MSVNLDRPPSLRAAGIRTAGTLWCLCLHLRLPATVVKLPGVTKAFVPLVYTPAKAAKLIGVAKASVWPVIMPVPSILQFKLTFKLTFLGTAGR